VVAIVVIAIGTVAGLRAFGQAGRDRTGLAGRLLAHEVVMTRADEIALLGITEAGVLPEEVEMGRHRFRITLARKPTRGGLVETEITATAEDGAGARLVAHFAAPRP